MNTVLTHVKALSASALHSASVPKNWLRLEAVHEAAQLWAKSLAGLPDVITTVEDVAAWNDALSGALKARTSYYNELRKLYQSTTHDEAELLPAFVTCQERVVEIDKLLMQARRAAVVPASAHAFLVEKLWHAFEHDASDELGTADLGSEALEKATRAADLARDGDYFLVRLNQVMEYNRLEAAHGVESWNRVVLVPALVVGYLSGVIDMALVGPRTTRTTDICEVLAAMLNSNPDADLAETFAAAQELI